MSRRTDTNLQGTGTWGKLTGEAVGDERGRAVQRRTAWASSCLSLGRRRADDLV